MSRTVTDLVSAQAYGDGTPLAAGKNAIAAGTTLFLLALQAVMTKSATEPYRVKLFYASSPFDLTAANGKLFLPREAQTLEITAPVGDQPLTKIVQTEYEVPKGDFLYYWFDEAVSADGVTVSLKLVEE